MTEPITSIPAHFQSFLAFDFGLKRTGVAVGTRMLRTATPQGTIRAEGDARFAQVAERLREWQPDALVVGVPLHPDGAPHENTGVSVGARGARRGLRSARVGRLVAALALALPGLRGRATARATGDGDGAGRAARFHVKCLARNNASGLLPGSAAAQ